jgi:hypothetical protein|tara:strand:+ start:114 stop:692 length:579 start_codon:yes stop_codon:yes gene_type:complete
MNKMKSIISQGNCSLKLLVAKTFVEENIRAGENVMRLFTLALVGSFLLQLVAGQERLDVTQPCQKAGYGSDGRGRPEYTIDWYLCCAKFGKETFEGCCMNCRCQWTMYFETAKKCFRAQLGSNEYKSYEERLKIQQEEWVQINVQHCGKPPLEVYSMDPTSIDYCAPASVLSFKLIWVFGFSAYLSFWLLES